jgi:hypothetical protein
MTFVWQPSFSVDKHVAIAQKCLLAYVDVAIQIHLSAASAGVYRLL